MARNENPPFARGQTFGNGVAVAATDGAAYEGKEFTFEDGAGGTVAPRSNRYVRCRVVRNNSGGTLTAPAKKLVKLDLGGTAVQNAMSDVSGFTATAADKGYPVDEYLAGNVVANDLFFIITDGPAKCTSDSAGATNFAVGQVVVPGAGTTGRIVTQDTTATGAALFNQIQNAIGKALEAVNAVSTDITIDVGGHTR